MRAKSADSRRDRSVVGAVLATVPTLGAISRADGAAPDAAFGTPAALTAATGAAAASTFAPSTPSRLRGARGLLGKRGPGVPAGDWLTPRATGVPAADWHAPLQDTATLAEPEAG